MKCSFYFYITFLIIPFQIAISPVTNEPSVNNNSYKLIYSIFQEDSPLNAEILAVSQISNYNLLLMHIPNFIIKELDAIKTFLILNNISPSLSSNASRLLLKLIIHNNRKDSLCSILNTLINNITLPLLNNDKAKLNYIITLIIMNDI